MFRGLQEAKKHVILLKIENFYKKSGLRFALSCHLSENIFNSNSYTGKFLARGKRQVRGELVLIFWI